MSISNRQQVFIISAGTTNQTACGSSLFSLARLAAMTQVVAAAPAVAAPEKPKLTPLEYRNLQKRPGETHKQYKARVKAFLNNPNHHF